MSGTKLRTGLRLWVGLEFQPFPHLHGLAPTDRDRFVLLDAYLRDCLEEWCAFGGQLSARSVVLLEDCARTITKHYQLLDGEGQYYFGQFRRLAACRRERTSSHASHSGSVCIAHGAGKSARTKCGCR